MNTIEKREGDKITAEKRKDAKHKDEKQTNYVETLEGLQDLIKKHRREQSLNMENYLDLAKELKQNAEHKDNS